MPVQFTPPQSSVIAVDGVFFQLNNTGIARVWQEAFEAWVKSGFAERVIIFDRDGTAPKIEGLRRVDALRYDAHRSGEDALMLQRLCDEHKVAAFISTYYTAPTTTRSAVFVYDMIGEILDQTGTSIEFQEKHAGILHASKLLALSEQTKRDLVKFHPWIREADVAVAHCAASRTFRPAASDEIEAFRISRGLTKPWLLVVGERVGVNGYKNVELVFRALSSMSESERGMFTLVCVGGKPDLEPALAAVAAGIDVKRERLSDDELRLAYAGAQALIYPSRYEGFGMPVAEAMATGCPVITCPCGSLPEVGGDAAIYVEPDDAEAMVNAIRQVLNPSQRRALAEAGAKQSAQFSFSRMAGIIAAELDALAMLTATADDVRRGMEWTYFRTVQRDGQLKGHEARSLQKVADKKGKQLAKIERALEKAVKRAERLGSSARPKWKDRLKRWLDRR